MSRRIVALVLVGLSVLVGVAAPPAPPPPTDWNVLLRYQIFAFRTERLKQYSEMLKGLKDVGFTRDPDEIIPDDEPDNEKYTRMQGTIPAGNVARLQEQKHVRSLLLYPKSTKLPAKGARVRVEMQLSSGYLPEVQRKLARQTAEALTRDAGFVEAVAYDHQKDTRLVGSVPVEQLDKIVEDVRKLPSAQDSAAPLRTVSPIRLAIARPDWPVPMGRTALPPVPANQEKFTLALRTLLGGANASKRTRLEAILGWTPAESDRTWQRLIEQTGAIVEGRLGPVVTVVGDPKEIAGKLAALPEIAHVRLPRSGRSHGSQDAVPARWEAVRASGLANIHATGRRGKGTRLAVIADDFTGWEKLKGREIGAGALPDPVLLDLTAERNRDLVPDPMPTGKGEGYGTRCARALLKAAPEAEVTLIRIDANAPYMLLTVAKTINGAIVRTPCLDRRANEIRADRAALERRQSDLLEERRRVLDNPTEDAEGMKAIKDYRAKHEAAQRDEEALQQRRDRYFALLRDMGKLKGIRVVASTLVWTDGYPVDGSGALSRFFDDRPFRAALWFQAAGDSARQAWTGLFRDADQNGTLEFTTATRLPAGSWSPELNFLGWQPVSGKAGKGLPSGARLRITLQWREAHAPLPLQVGEDPYREPLTSMSLVVVAQPDPEGKTRPADDLNMVTGSVGRPVRIDQNANSATYEHTVELQVKKPGRYAVFVEGKLAESLLAPGEAQLPSSRKVSEVRPRLFVQTLEGNGRAIWSDFATSQSTMGMPADARIIVSVGAADQNDKPRPSSASGPPGNLGLLQKPDVLAYDEGGGTGEAASFAAGFAASAWPLGGTLFGVLDRMEVRPGAVLRVPKR